MLNAPRYTENAIRTRLARCRNGEPELEQPGAPATKPSRRYGAAEPLPQPRRKLSAAETSPRMHGITRFQHRKRSGSNDKGRRSTGKKKRSERKRPDLYHLDGMPIDGAELAGQSGRLQINIGIRQKDDISEIWRDNYAVQASLSLDSENCKNIEAFGATIATVGGNKQLSYIILPGKDKDFTVTANVSSFELSGISFNMIPLSLSIDDPDTTKIKDKLYELQDGAVELDDGVFDLDDEATRLDDGAGKLDDGVNRLRDGVAELADGVDELRDGADDLRDGASDILNGSRDIRKGTNQLYDGIGALESGAHTFSGSLSQLNSQSAVLRAGSAQVKDGLGQLTGAVSGIDAESAARNTKPGVSAKIGLSGLSGCARQLNRNVRTATWLGCLLWDTAEKM